MYRVFSPLSIHNTRAHTHTPIRSYSYVLFFVSLSIGRLFQLFGRYVCVCLCACACVCVPYTVMRPIALHRSPPYKQENIRINVWKNLQENVRRIHVSCAIIRAVRALVCGPRMDGWVPVSA